MSQTAPTFAEINALLTALGAPFELEEQEIGAVAFPVWKQAPRTLNDVMAAGLAFGSRDFLVLDNMRISFAAHHAAASRLAHELITRFGVEPGDRVGIAMRNHPHWVVCFHAILLAGAIATPYNAWWKEGELAHALNNSEPRLVFADAARMAMLQQIAASPASNRPALVLAGVGDAATGRLSLDDLIGPSDSWAQLEPQAPPQLNLTPDDDAVLMYTSGTGGTIHGVIATHRNIISSIWNLAFCKARVALRAGKDPRNEGGAQPVSLLSTPLFHGTACFTNLIPAHLSGARLVMQRRFDPHQALELIAREGVTSVGGVPTIAWRLIEAAEDMGADLSSVTLVGYGGAPSSPQLVRRIREVFPNAAPGNGWGMTETCATCTINIGGDYLAHPDSAGLPAPSTRLRIVDDDGCELPIGEVGEIEVFGPQNARSYWRAPKASAAVFRDGWVRSGDLGRLDENGFLTIVDRKKDMIIRGGENIFCPEVEAALMRHPDVLDAGVVGLPHESLGEIVGAVVQLRPGVKAGPALDEALRHHVGAHLAAFKAPTRITFATSPLPRNINGKMLKPQLKAMLQESGDDSQIAGSGQTAHRARTA